VNKQNRKVLVVGGNVAGLMAAVSAREEDAQADITVVSKEPHSPYRRPAIPSLIAGEITDLEEVAVFRPDYLSAQRINLQRGVEAVRLDVKDRSVQTRAIVSGEVDELHYEALVLATGSYPPVPRIKGADKAGVCTFTTYEAAKQIIEFAEHSSTAVVVGAGFIALEIAEALMRKGLMVYFNVRSRILRRLLEPDLSAHLAESFERRGLQMLTGESIGEIGGGEKVEFVTMGQEKIPASIVIFGTGVSPNVDLARAAGIELGRSGAIRVDNRMQTSAKDIYAAGDCAESPDLATGEFLYSPVGSIAAMGGQVAGANAAGGNRETPGFVRAQTDKTLGQEITSIGHSSTTARDSGLQVKVHDLSQMTQDKEETSLSRRYPAKVKVLVDTADRIVGAQVVTAKYASQYSYGLLRAVLQHMPLADFLRDWKLPLDAAAGTMSLLSPRLSSWPPLHPSP